MAQTEFRESNDSVLKRVMEQFKDCDGEQVLFILSNVAGQLIAAIAERDPAAIRTGVDEHRENVLRAANDWVRLTESDDKGKARLPNADSDVPS